MEYHVGSRSSGKTKKSEESFCKEWGCFKLAAAGQYYCYYHLDIRIPLSRYDDMLKEIADLKAEKARLELESDQSYDCLIQILQEQFGDKYVQQLHELARKRYAAIQPTTEAEPQPESTQEKRKEQFFNGDHWKDK